MSEASRKCLWSRTLQWKTIAGLPYEAPHIEEGGAMRPLGPLGSGQFGPCPTSWQPCSYPVSNEGAQHGWTQRKIFNTGTSRWPRKAVSGAFVVNRV